MDAEKYLHRIGIFGPVTPTLETLKHIHYRHLLSVPFENLTIHSGGQIHLELPRLYDKIVCQQRGGFCFENNGLFSWLLSELGFEVTVLSAQVKNSITGVYGPQFDHFVIMVTLEGRRWLCDVGFGAGFAVPISLETDGPQKQDHGVFQIRRERKTIYLEQEEIVKKPLRTIPEEGDDHELTYKNKKGTWTELYKFTLQPRQREDFVAMCTYHQTSPSSVFYCKSLCSLLLPNGRVTYMGHKLIITSFPPGEGGLATKTIEERSDEEIPGLLKEIFGIVLPSPILPKDEDIIPPPATY